MTVRELYKDKSCWTQGAYARDAFGVPILTNHPTAVSWCLMGALSKCYGAERGWKKTDVGVQWNDSPNRTFEQVLAHVIELNL